MAASPALSVQLYSIPEAVAADLPAALARLAGMGLTRVEPFDLSPASRAATVVIGLLRGRSGACYAASGIAAWACGGAGSANDGGATFRYLRNSQEISRGRDVSLASASSGRPCK